MSITTRTLDDCIEVEADALSELKGNIRGRIILPTDSEYNESRKIWNAMIDRRPAFIVQCTGTRDVIQAVKFAKKHHLLISVRGAGHNIAGRSLHDQSMLIDLSQMRNVTVDPEEQTVTVRPGATLGDLDHETQHYGLALPVGINSTTGVGGLTLGGGFGWLSRQFGMTVDHLISAEVVTVDGERLSCSQDSHPDLFWAIRGGGGNFGIVTSFKFGLVKVGPEVMSGPLIFKMEDAKQVLENLRKFCENCLNEVSVWSVFRDAPPFPFLDSSYHGKRVLVLVAFHTGSLEEGKLALDQLNDLGNPIGNGIAPHTFTKFQQAFDPLLVPGARNYWKTHNFIDISDGLLDTILDYAKKLPNQHSEIFLAQMGGVTNQVPKNETAYPHRDVNFIMNVHTRWENASDDEKCITWARDFYQATRPYATGGAYVNFLSEGDDTLEGAFAENIERLAKVKAKYDPRNVLRSNLNITPSG